MCDGMASGHKLQTSAIYTFWQIEMNEKCTILMRNENIYSTNGLRVCVRCERSLWQTTYGIQQTNPQIQLSCVSCKHDHVCKSATVIAAAAAERLAPQQNQKKKQ